MGINRTIAVKRGAVFFCFIFLCFACVRYGRIYLPQAWINLRLVNTVVNLVPIFLAILFAFVVDKDLAGRMRWRWAFRVAVVSIGLGLSGLLWHQQTLTDEASAKQISGALTAAVSQANDHADKKLEEVNKDVVAVQGQVQGLGEQLNKQSDQLGENLGDINTSIGKVGKPDPPPTAALQFSIWDSSVTEGHPLLVKTVQQDASGYFPVDFSFINVSETNAEAIDFWVQVCELCSFVADPAGFDNPSGSDVHVRHRSIQQLNPGVSFEKSTVLVKAPSLDSFRSPFDIPVKRAEPKKGSQIITVYPLQSSHFPKLKPQ